MSFEIHDLGRLSYGEAEELQREILEEVLQGNQPQTLLLVEHPSILTLGANFHQENLLHSRSWYEERGIEIATSGRGGDVTYHGPGQLVAYPIFALEPGKRDLHLWLRELEEVVILALAEFGVTGDRLSPHTGVWVGHRKICALGIKVRKWVSMHGLALNCDNDLAPFGWIVPCGISEYGVTSLTAERGKRTTVEEAKPILIKAFQTVFA